MFGSLSYLVVPNLLADLQVPASPEEQRPMKRKPAVNNNNPSGNVFADEQVGDTGGAKGAAEESSSPFNGIIGECFLPYLYIYIESLDRNLYELMEKFMSESKKDLSNEQPVSAAVHGVLPSCADLFVFYKKFLVQCNQLSNGPPMLSLSNTFEKYLREYAVKILQNNLPKLGGSTNTSSLSASMTNITRDLRDISSASSIIQNFLKEGEVARFSKAEIARICWYANIFMILSSYFLIVIF
ncbi:Vacuolar protein sorting-associated protein 53 [Homalodisca vitripennis]|nr:Vacuolar protein sorting-associated protein 53 [Homalodisca vitripennis]